MAMRNFAQLLRRRVHHLLTQEDATTATEYAVMLALIIVVSLAAISALGDGLANNVAWTVTEALS
jgi:Flp pilus assembly pilin Flp